MSKQHDFWYEQDVNRAHTDVYANYRELCRKGREDLFRKYSAYYLNRNIRGVGWDAFSAAATAGSSSSVDMYFQEYESCSTPLIKTLIDELSSKIGKKQPSPFISTQAGDTKTQRKAERLTQWLLMQYYKLDIPAQARLAFRDACVYGTGIIKTYIKEDNICVERVYPGEIFVDEFDGLYGEPSEIFQRKYISKRHLKKMYPEKKSVIESTYLTTDEYSSYTSEYTTTDHIEVIEAWKLPSKKGAGDGRHIISISEGTLVDEVYELDFLPFSVIRWNHDLRGWYGVGLTEELLKTHININITDAKIQKAMELTASPMVFVLKGSGINAQEFTNIPGSVIESNQQYPQVVTPSPFPQEYIQYKEMCKQEGREIAGLSSSLGQNMSANRAETGLAFANFHAIETERFSTVAADYEMFFKHISKKLVACGKQISELYPDYSVVLESSKYTVESVPWGDIELNLDDESYVLKIFPASEFSTLPTARIAEVTNLMNSGLASRDMALEVLNLPDLDRQMDLELAPVRYLQFITDEMLNDGKYRPPTPFMDLQKAKQICLQKINQAYLTKVPQNRISVLERFMSQVQAMINKAQQEVLQQQAQLVQPGVAAAGADDLEI